MSEPGDELYPIEEQPPEKAGLSRSPYVALGVAAVVVATAFATVAALASGGENDQSQPEPVNNETIEMTTVDENGTTRVTTTVVTPTTTTTTPTTTTTTKKKTTTTTPPQRTTTTTTTPPPPAPKPPVAKFDAGCTDESKSCSFDGGGSSDPEGGNLTYSWNFGDGSGGGGGVVVSHTYAAAGTYTVKLTVTDQQGLSNTTSKSVTITEPPTPPAGTTTP